jgi:hypothetical protein
MNYFLQTSNRAVTEINKLDNLMDEKTKHIIKDRYNVM